MRPSCLAVNDALSRLVDGLADPARRRRAALCSCSATAVLWFIYALIAKSSQDLNADMAEMIVWTRELASATRSIRRCSPGCCGRWFKIFPLADWS